jgi:hypothetical protein
LRHHADGTQRLSQKPITRRVISIQNHQLNFQPHLMPTMLAMYDPQEIIFYCESCFWAILNALNVAEGEKENWIKLGMEKELVSMICS